MCSNPFKDDSRKEAKKAQRRADQERVRLEGERKASEETARLAELDRRRVSAERDAAKRKRRARLTQAGGALSANDDETGGGSILG